MAGSSFNPYYPAAPAAPTGNVTDFDVQAAELARRRRLAELLQQQAMNYHVADPRGRASLLGPIAAMFQMYQGNKGVEDVNQQEQALEKKRSSALSQLLTSPMGTPQAAPTQPSGPEDDTAQAAAPMLPAKPPTPEEVMQRGQQIGLIGGKFGQDIAKQYTQHGLNALLPKPVDNLIHLATGQLYDRAKGEFIENPAVQRKLDREDARADETERHNRAMEGINTGKGDQTDRRLEEMQRHNQAMERLGGMRITVNAPPAAGDLDKDTVDFYAKQSLAGDNSWQVGLARGKVGQALIAAVKDRIPQLAKEADISPQEASANKASNTALGAALRDREKFVAAGQQFSRNMQSQADLVDKYMTKGTAGGVPAINKWIQAGRVALAGDPDVSALDTAIRGLAREHQRIVTGVTSNAQLHVAAQQTADELLNKAQTPQQIRAVLKVMREEADNAIEAGKTETVALRARIGQLGKGSTAAAEAPKGAGKVDPVALAKEAKAAIAAGKDPAAVRARYKQMTGQDLN